MTLLEFGRIARAHDDHLLCDEIESIFEQLTDLGDLEPGPRVNRLLSHLVRLCVSVPAFFSERVLADPVVRSLAPQLRNLCGHAEYLLERHWARAIAAADDPQDRLAAFPYLRNYQQLTDLELHMLAGVGCNPSKLRRICFLGGGPLPLSALLLGQRLSVTVDIVDRDHEASLLAHLVVDRLGVSDRLRTWTAEAVEFPLLADCDVVVLAALVGAHQADKHRILAGLAERMRPGSLIVARGAHGLRTLLYPAIDVANLDGWRPLALAHPFTDVVNSVLVAIRP
jgi:nicotianamine synthase